MTESLHDTAMAVNRHFARERPSMLARRLEATDPAAAARILRGLEADELAAVWERISPDLGRDIFDFLPHEPTVKQLLERLSPTALVNLLGRCEEAARATCLQLLGPATRDEVSSLLEYPEGTAGRAMNPRFQAGRTVDTADQGLTRLRREGIATVLYVVDDDLRLIGRVPLSRLAFAPPDSPLEDLMDPIAVKVAAVAPIGEVIEAARMDSAGDVPITDVEGRLIGFFQESQIADVAQRDATADVQSMVGASREERALSPIGFAVRKRMGWLQINLLTAFLAAAVVGLFEDTIARVTALAVLLPVVAGQSGNAGAQALAVTMRGLALREITLRHTMRVTWKEVRVGFLNGLAVAVTCGIGVWVWSGSFGLVVVISTSMVLAMIAAGLAGALVPIGLTRIGQDPATASSIVLTTVTDVAGFFCFLGIASLLMATL